MTIDISFIKKGNRSDLIRLYREAGWWDDKWNKDTSFLDGIVARSALFAAAYDDNAMIGMGRALSDGVSDAYIQDVTVLGAYRGKGIGSRIIRALITRLKETGVNWIGLISEPGTDSFYTRLGFEKMKNHTPYKLTNQF